MKEPAELDRRTCRKLREIAAAKGQPLLTILEDVMYDWWAISGAPFMKEMERKRRVANKPRRIAKKKIKLGPILVKSKKNSIGLKGSRAKIVST
jgi:hypothetical protein